ncbi:MAG: hypothetical protein KDE47_23255, partial [Caldilineaceae bacterium]|nr:hypothetical protein [Caldilineaceae bacterium]
MLTDGWSTAILAREFLTLYQAACTGQSAELPSAPPYQQYIRWLRKQDVAQS